MKKIILITILVVTAISFTNTSYSTDKIITSQMESLNLSSFIKEGQNYTKEVFPDLNLEDFFASTIRGEINNKSILTSILSLFGDEIVSTIALLRKYFNNNSCT